MNFIPAYVYNNKIYLNLTNRCPNNCSFCIRTIDSAVGYDLWLTKEPSAQEILDAVANLQISDEIIFCGYGEPLLRPDVVIEVAKELKKKYNSKIRINTNGLAEQYLGYEFVPKLKGLVDIMSISLNADNSELYNKLCAPSTGINSFSYMLAFAKKCTEYVPRVVLSVVALPEIDLEKCKIIAQDVGAELRIRKQILS